MVRVEAAALNFSDLLMIDDHYQVRPPRPFVPGQEIAGLVFRDLHWKFFSILARRTPHRLQELVEAWKEQGEDCEKIPVLGRHRRCRAELRTLAAQVLKRLLAPAPLPFRRKLSNEPKR